MKNNYFSQLNKKLALITGIISISAVLGVPAIAQVDPNQTPSGTTETPSDTTQPSTTTPTVPPDSTQPPTTTPTVPPDSTQPPGSTTETPSNTNNAAGGNIVQVAAASDSFKTFAQAVEAAGLTDTLSSGKYTIFAPTDQAFSTSLPQGALQVLLQPENKDLLRQVLSYHVVRGEVDANDLKTGPVKTLGGSVAIRVTPQRVVVNDASVTQADIKASNGVIHAVNRVLLPRQLREAIASKISTQPTQPPQ
jgi:uncharacterized surface protein with fasciclin (FAS1) repeats